MKRARPKETVILTCYALAAATLGAAVWLAAHAPFATPAAAALPGNASAPDEAAPPATRPEPAVPLLPRGTPYPYSGIAQVAGNAYGAVPLLPLTRTGAGFLRGETHLAASEHQVERLHSVLPWFSPCSGNLTGSGLSGGRGDGLLYPAARLPDAAPLRPEDVPAAGVTRAVWNRTATPEGEGIPVLLVRLAPGEASSSAARFAPDGVLAVHARAPYTCAPLQPRAEADRARATPEGLPPDPLLLVEPASGSAWNPRWIVRGVLVQGLTGSDLAGEAPDGARP